MNKLHKFAFLTILLILLTALALPGTAYASDTASQNRRELHDQFVFGDTYTLHKGDTLVGDLFILGGTVTLEEDSRVEGNVILVGGSLSIQGVIEKDLVALGGTPYIEQTGRIGGDAVTIGSNLSGNTEGVAGKIITERSGVFNIKMFDERFPTVGVARVPYLWDILSTFFSVFFMTAMAIGIVLIMPKQTDRTARVLVQQPVASGGMGCLTVIVAPIILVALAITIILIPVSLLGAALLVVLVIFGWVAIGLESGKRLALALHQNWHPAVSAGVGTFGLTLVTLGLSRVIICVGWMLPLLVSMVGLGAVMLVFFGARQMPASGEVAMQPAAPLPGTGSSGLESASAVEVPSDFIAAPPEQASPDIMDVPPAESSSSPDSSPKEIPPPS
jgi:hypothetical protein